MKQNRIVTLVFLALVIAALTLSACGPKATPEPVTLTVKGLVTTELQLSDSALHKMTVVTLNLTHPKNGPEQRHLRHLHRQRWLHFYRQSLRYHCLRGLHGRLRRHTERI